MTGWHWGDDPRLRRAKAIAAMLTNARYIAARFQQTGDDLEQFLKAWKCLQPKTEREKRLDERGLYNSRQRLG
jgi:3-methyladenine DNA glycosylase Tag